VSAPPTAQTEQVSNQVKPIKQPVSAFVASKPKADAKQEAARSKNS